MSEETRRAGWEGLADELDAWRAAGRGATLWWRDDDAVGVTDALETMLEIGASTRTPLALAVIPARAETALRDRLDAAEGVGVLQHGFAHLNHQPEGGKKSEFGGARDSGQAEAEISEGRKILSGWRSCRPVFVPPWNRIDPRFVEILPKLGIAAISTFKARPEPNPAPGLLAVNCHVDIIQSRAGGRHFIGAGAAVQAITDHLSSRRRGRVDSDEPTGILTHHLDHNNDGWRFLERLLGTVGDHPAARWLDAADVFKEETL